MIVSKYDVAVDQLENHGSLHYDAHMLFTKTQEEQLEIITSIMTQLSPKSGLKEWGNKSQDSVHYDMEEIHFRNTFKSKH